MTSFSCLDQAPHKSQTKIFLPTCRVPLFTHVDNIQTIQPYQQEY